MDSGGSMNISTSQALNENISTSRELHENISISQAMGIETSSSLHSSNLSGARLSEPTSISRAMGIETPILHSSNTDPSGDRINKSSLISQSRDQSSAYSHQLTPTTSQLTDASNQSLPTGLNPRDSSLPSPSPERDVPNSPPPCIEPPSVSCSQSRISTLSSQPLNSSSSVNNPSSLSSQNSTNNQSSLHSPHSQNNPKSSQSSLNNPSFVNSPKSLHRPNSPISSSSQNSSDSKVSLGPLCSDSTANPQVENDLSRVPQVKSVTSKVQPTAKSQVENSVVQLVNSSVVLSANPNVVQLASPSVVQLASPSVVQLANASLVQPASPCHAKTVSSNQHALSSSESSDENFDRHTGREKTSVPRRISVEAVIEQIPRDVERGDVPGTDRLKGLVGSSHPGIDLCKGLSESSVDKDKQEGQDQLKESCVDKDQHKSSKEIDGQTDEIGKTSEKVPKLDESKEVYDPMSQSNELDQKTETRTSTCAVSNPGQNLDPKPDAKVSASDNTSDGSPKKESKTNEAKKSKSKNSNSKASEPASKGNSGKNNSKLPLVKNKETSPSESNRSKVAGGESKSKPSKQGEVSQKQASKDQTQASLGDSTGKNAETKKNLNETGVKSEETKRNSKTSTSIRTSSDVSTGSKSSGSTSEENLNKTATVSDRKGTIKTPPANTNEPVAKDKPSSKKTTEPSADKLTSPSGKKATESSAKSVTTGPVKKSVPKTNTSPKEEGASKPLALSARKSLPLTTSNEFASCKSVALSARKSLPLTSSSDAGAKPTQGDLGKPITLIKTNGLGEDCRMKPTSSIPVVSQHRKMSVYKPPIPGMSD
ncbi:dentin sialophosphoprotein-like isoform X2 [Diaphorina citri]|uniref:Dentin sialophosphoprotein-like isoform X2 n=1 Tax=Diaphorina citri TaxID=121845 RepID=A0A3Q0JD35_DIACI|nr:dentin sialophosphoprotein-like isoform X2 [Diaphorina citri]